jgi:hypothetical protein
MLCRRFCDSDPEFEPGLNRDLAIQAKTAILVAKDSPAAQISPPWPFALAKANYLIAGRVAEAGNGVRRGGLQKGLPDMGRWSECGTGRRW